MSLRRKLIHNFREWLPFCQDRSSTAPYCVTFRPCGPRPGSDRVGRRLLRISLRGTAWPEWTPSDWRWRDRAVPGAAENELVHHRRAEGVVLLQLSLVLRLSAHRIENRVDGIGGCRLRAVIGAEVDEQAIVRSDSVDPTARSPDIHGEVPGGGVELQSARCSSVTKSVE